MKLSQNSFSEYDYYITPSEIIEFLYCRRFTYFMKCLGIRQYEENRYKVQIGREIHERREQQNRDYLRKKIGSCKKEISVNLVSRTLCIRGKVDEVHTLVDGTLAPLDYKFARYEEKIYETYKTQLILYSLMIEENYGIMVKRGYLVFCRGGNQLVEVEISDKDKKNAVDAIEEYKKVLNGFFPKATRYKARCIDCCYKNICIK